MLKRHFQKIFALSIIRCKPTLSDDVTLCMNSFNKSTNHILYNIMMAKPIIRIIHNIYLI